MTSEPISVQLGQDFDLIFYLGVLRRRVLYLLAPFVFGSVVTYFVATFLPPVYQSAAKILVESQQIPTGLAQSTVTANAAERIQIISQRLLARDNLLEISRKFSLYPSRQLSPTQLVDLMRRATNIDQIDVGQRSNPQPNSQAIGFTVSFDYYDPLIASRVANEFVSSILQQNIQSRTNRAAETSKFFEQQLKRLEQQLAAQGARIVDFKEKNQSALPESLGSRSTFLGQLQAQSTEIAGKIAALEFEKELLTQRALNTPDGTALDPNADATALELDRLRTQLVQLKAVFTDGHPEVRKLKAQITAMEEAADIPAAPSKGPVKSSPSALTAPGGRVSSQIALLDQQLGALKTRRTEIDQSILDVNAKIQKTPEVQVALDALVRDLDGLQTQYREVQAKLADAATGEQLEEDKQAERFEVLEQATVPSEPISPNRPRIFAVGTVASAAAGIGLVALMEVLDRSIRGSVDLERRLQIRPISTIPYINTHTDRRRRRRRRTAMFAVAILAVALAGTLLFYLPFERIAAGLIRRLGV